MIMMIVMLIIMIMMIMVIIRLYLLVQASRQRRNILKITIMASIIMKIIIMVIEECLYLGQ